MMSTMRMRMTCGLLRSMAMLDPGAALKLKVDLFKGTIKKTIQAIYPVVIWIANIWKLDSSDYQMIRRMLTKWYWRQTNNYSFQLKDIFAKFYGHSGRFVFKSDLMLPWKYIHRKNSIYVVFSSSSLHHG